MKLLFILVCSLHLVGGRCKVIKNGFEGDTSDKRFLDNVVNEKRNLLSRRPEIAETGAGFCTSLLFYTLTRNKLGNALVFVQLIFGPGWSMNQLYKNLPIY